MATYEKAILTHIDIMGFSTLIDESQKDPQSVRGISNALKSIRRQFSIGGRDIPRSGGEPSGRFDSINFSDLTVRVTYIDEGDSLLECLVSELWHLVSIQYDLTISGILIRGGISFGDIYCSPDKSSSTMPQWSGQIIFGPALVSAYTLESKIAVFPRIVIDPTLMEEVHKSPSNFDFDGLRQGEDGIFFVDYLRAKCDVGYDFEDIERMLSAHKDSTLRKLKQLNGNDDKIKQKALWLALYHNTTIERHWERLKERYSRSPFDPPKPPAPPLEYERFCIDENAINQPKT